MGIYLVSNNCDEWSDEDVHGGTAAAIDEELSRRGLPPFSAPQPTPFTRGTGTMFEEKLYRPMGTFETLCRTHGSEQQAADALLDWTILLPVALAEPIVLDIPCPHDDVTAVRGAPEALVAARHLARVIGLPPQIPQHCDNLDLGIWFDSAEAVGAAAATHPGPWTEDLDRAFYVAVYLRAAEHSLRHRTPISYS
jgi:hypothetical protein